ncbi:MAG: hypothetical protein WAM85_05230 [Terracidiphilus sp.]
MIERKQREAGEIKRLKSRIGFREGLKQRQSIFVAMSAEICHAKISFGNRIVIPELKGALVESYRLVIAPLAGEGYRKIVKKLNRMRVHGERPPK